MRTKSLRFTERLPATLVEPTIRKQVVAIAKSRGVSLGEIQREALAAYLAQTQATAAPQAQGVQS